MCDGVELLRLAAKGASGVDHDARVILGVSCAQAVEALGHGVMLDAKTLEQLVELGNGTKGRGIKSRYTHPGLSSDGLGRFLGRLRDWRIVDDKAVADLHISEMASKSPEGDIGAYVLGLANEDPEAFGMSVVISLSRVWVLESRVEVPWRQGDAPPEGATSDMPIARVKQLHACDVVDEPAANRDGLFSSMLSSGPLRSARGQRSWLWGTNKLAAEAFGELDRLLEHYQVSPARAFEFALSYCAARGVNVSAFRVESNQSEEQSEMSAFGVEPDQGEEQVDMSEAVEVTAPAEGGSNGVDEVNVWVQAAARAAVESVINGSGLPAASRERLGAGAYDSPEALEAAIERERAYLAKLQADKAVTGLRPTVEAVRDARDQIQSSMDWMFGVPGATPPPPNLRSLRDLYLHITGDYDFRGIFDPERAGLASATTTTLPGLAVNSLNKAILLHYESMQTWRWFEPIVLVLPHDGTTHDVQMIMVDGVANLPTVDEGDPYTEATVGDSKEVMSFAKRGQFVGITLEMIRRSVIARIQAIPRSLVMASLRTRSAAIAGIFTANGGLGPVMADDGENLFDDAHGNLGSTAFSAEEWAVARKAIWSQQVPGTGSAFGLWPTYGLFPIDLYDEALELFGYGTGDVGKPNTAGNAQTVNPYGLSRPGDPRPIPIAVPEWSNPDNFAYIVDPRLHPVICMAYASQPNGGSHAAPEIFSATRETEGLMFTNDTLAVKVRDWWAYGVATYIGIGKNNV